MAIAEQLSTEHLDLWTAAIKRKSSAGRGSSSKVELYGIKKLRELILGTALRGLINLESEALPRTIQKDIRIARDSYYKKIGRKLKEYDFGPPLLREFDLPSGWAWKRIGDLCDLQTGATPNTQNPKYFGGDIRWLVSGDINQGVIEDCEGRITEEGVANSNCKILPPKTVLIALNGQGKTRASVALLNVPAACNQSLVGMIPFDASILDSSFLLLSLRYRYREIRDITGQNQRRGLNMGLVSELSIPLPPIAEQHRIVAKVDQLMAICDQLEQLTGASLTTHQALVETLLGALIKAIDHAQFDSSWQLIAEYFDILFITEESIDQLKQIILQLAVMGKLVPQDPKDEPASELLKKIAAERAKLVKKGKIKKEKLLLQVSKQEVLFGLPNGWSWARFGSVVSFESELVAPQDFQDSDQVAPDSIEKGTGKLLFRRTVAETGVAGPNNKFYAGQILYSKIRPSLSKAIIAEFDGLCSADMYPLGVVELSKQFLLKVILSESFLVQVRREENRIKMPKLNIPSLSNFVVAIPPLNEQLRIVAKADELFAICDQLKSRLSNAQTTQLHLADALILQSLAEA